MNCLPIIGFYFQILTLFITKKHTNKYKLIPLEDTFFRVSLRMQLLHFCVWLFNIILYYNDLPIYKNIQTYIVLASIIFLNMHFFVYKNNLNKNMILSFNDVYDSIKNYYYIILMYLAAMENNDKFQKNNMMNWKLLFNVIISIVIINIFYYFIKNKFITTNIFLILLYQK